jgi:hypothetical protein
MPLAPRYVWGWIFTHVGFRGNQTRLGLFLSLCVPTLGGGSVDDDVLASSFMVSQGALLVVVW